MGFHAKSNFLFLFFKRPVMHIPAISLTLSLTVMTLNFNFFIFSLLDSVKCINFVYIGAFHYHFIGKMCKKCSVEDGFQWKDWTTFSIWLKRFVLKNVDSAWARVVIGAYLSLNPSCGARFGCNPVFRLFLSVFLKVRLCIRSIGSYSSNNYLYIKRFLTLICSNLNIVTNLR